MIYQELWELAWPFIFLEWFLDTASVYALFRPFTGLLRGLNRINWGKFYLGIVIGIFLRFQGDFTDFEQFLVGSAPATFLVIYGAFFLEALAEST